MKKKYISPELSLNEIEKLFSTMCTSFFDEFPSEVEDENDNNYNPGGYF